MLYHFAQQKTRKVILLLASYSFYVVWDWRFLPLLLFSTFLDFFTGKLLWREQNPFRRKLFLGISLFGNLMPLAFFKYFNFIADNLNVLSASFDYSFELSSVSVILPLGISFYTFQTLSYSIDLFKRKTEPAKNLLDFSLFVSFFPQLIAGPIEKSQKLLPQLLNLSPLKRRNLKYGLLTLLYGLFLKSIIGDSCAPWVDMAFSETMITSPVEKLLGMFLFSVQIYMDFAGYSLMAIGIGRCFGIKLSTNFSQPYLANNVTDFWRRWHITLSNWLKEYIYIPLGGDMRGNKSIKIKQVRNVLITMLIGGLWHGANWTFIAWGGIHGVALVLHKQFKNQLLFIPKVLSIVFTFLFVSLVWVLFRANSMEHAMAIYSEIGHVFSSELNTPMWQPFIWCGGGMFLLDLFNRYYGTHLFVRKWPKSIQYGVIAATTIVLLVYLAPQRPQPFIYFQF